MPKPTTAEAELQAMLGATATDDATWRELRHFEAALIPAVDQHWPEASPGDTAVWRLIHHHTDEDRAEQEARLAAASATIAAMLGEELAASAAAFYLHPQLWQPAQGFRHRAREESLLHAVYTQLGGLLAARAVAAARPADWVARLARRALACCRASAAHGSPDLAECVGHLLQAEGGLVGELLDSLAVGSWDRAWLALCTLAGEPPTPDPSPLRDRWRSERRSMAAPLLLRLHERGRLDSHAFRSALEAAPESLRALSWALEGHRQGPGGRQRAERFAALRPLVDAALWEMLGDMRPESWPALTGMGQLSGGRVLLRLVEEIDRRGITALPRPDYAERGRQIGDVIAALLEGLARRPEDDPAALADLLRRLPAPALLLALPRARPYEPEICAALGLDAAPLLALLHRIEEADDSQPGDPRAGTVRPEEIRAAAARVGEEQLRTFLEAYAPHRRTGVLLVRAALGWNRAEVRRMLGRRNRAAAVAFALLPIERPEEVLQRYLLLRRFERDAAYAPASRRPHDRLAAQAALATLAASAGYTSATRLEWAMEDRLGAEAVAIGRAWAIERYTLTLALHDDGPAIEVRSPKRLLRRTPAAVRRDYAFREVQEVLDQARAQERRYRQALLDAMRTAQPIAPEELALLRRNPIAAHLLARLVLIDAAGGIGLYRAEDNALEGARGERLAVSGSVTVAHPYALERAGVLEDWQAEVVRARVVQPFRQVFRELYLLTPAEEQAGHASARLAGRRVRGRQAAAVLANLGWMIDDGYAVTRPIYEHGIQAIFEVGSLYDEDGGRTGELSFAPIAGDNPPHRERRVRLADVPPLALSETLRDLDMVTAIAHQSDDGAASQEVLRRRADLVRAVTGSLGMRQVTVEERHATVRGSLTSYRVHLATAAVYLDGGQYLCIVPSERERKGVYLPFAEGGDPVASELISKVLLLANDAGIRDGTILAQIARAPVAA